MNDFVSLLRAGIESVGATGLVDFGGCGCGLNGLMPCGSPTHYCQAAYAVVCDGSACDECIQEWTTGGTICFLPVEMMEDGDE